jgi:hypothetical protein
MKKSILEAPIVSLAAKVVDNGDRYRTILSKWPERESEIRRRIKAWANRNYPDRMRTVASPALDEFVKRLVGAVHAELRIWARS